MGIINRFTNTPLYIHHASTLKGNIVSKSHKLFADLGLMYLKDGVGTLMPLLVKSLKKLEKIIHKEMREIGAVECMLPILTEAALLEKSGRLGLSELFKVTCTGNQNYVLSPTCEEAVTNVMTLYQPLSYKYLPIRLYQISNKFRDEKRNRAGLLRSREFVMKDLYCFDTSEATCEESYKEIVNQYNHFFEVLQVPHLCLEGLTGDIGGSMSQEFFFLSDAGEDKIFSCKNCGHTENMSFLKDSENTDCKKCQSSNVVVNNAIEVGHAFKLGTKYTEPFNATYINDNMEREFLHMSCFGLGLTRILAATVEVLCKSEEIRWPISIAPYLVCIIAPKAGSREEAAAQDTANTIYHSLSRYMEDDVIIDDCTSLSIGKRLLLNKKFGFPFHVVIGKSICESPPKVEVIDCNAGSVDLVQIPDLNQFILSKLAVMLKSNSHEENISVQL